MPGSKRPTTAELPCDGPIDRYQFAQAALTGLLLRFRFEDADPDLLARKAWDIAGSMVKEGLRRDRARAEQLNPQSEE